MYSVSSRNWTRAAVFISYDDNNYTTGTSYQRKAVITRLKMALSRILFGHITTFLYHRSTQTYMIGFSTSAGVCLDARSFLI